MTHRPTSPRMFADMVAQSRLAMVTSDMSRPDRPLVFVNDAFVAMTGYGRAQCIGRNCRFLQGPDTSPDTVEAIRETIARGDDGYFEILNYNHDGTSFWNGLHIGPIFDEHGATTLYFGAQRDVSAQVEARKAETLRARELAHRMGNLLAIVSTMVRSSAKGEGEDALRQSLEDRLFALSRSNALVTPLPGEGASDDRRVSLHHLLDTVLNPIASTQIDRAGPAIDLHQSDVTNVALVVHELATNALKHGALSVAAGRVSVDWRLDDGRVLVDWHETGGPVVHAPTRKGMGSRLLNTVAQASHRGDAGLDHAREGVRYRFDAALR